MTISPQTVKDRVTRFEARCRERGLKVTHQRTEIYRELARTDMHPDAERIYKQVRRRIPAISLDTVYRTLRLLEEEELIACVGVIGDRSRYDADPGDHAHFVCTCCGTVSDVYDVNLEEVLTQRLPDGIHKVDSVHVELRGRCGNCSQLVEKGVEGA